MCVNFYFINNFKCKFYAKHFVLEKVCTKFVQTGSGFGPVCKSSEKYSLCSLRYVAFNCFLWFFAHIYSAVMSTVLTVINCCSIIIWTYLGQCNLRKIRKENMLKFFLLHVYDINMPNGWQYRRTRNPFNLF
jgi:hypothetical protein